MESVTPKIGNLYEEVGHKESGLSFIYYFLSEERRMDGAYRTFSYNEREYVIEKHLLLVNKNINNDFILYSSSSDKKYYNFIFLMENCFFLKTAPIDFEHFNRNFKRIGL